MQESQIKYYLYGMLISPVLMVFIAFNQFHRSSARRYLWIYSGLFGLFIIMPEGYDGFVHASNVEKHYYGLAFFQFLDEAWQLLILNPPKDTNDDIFLHVISYFAAFFGSSKGVFFLIIGLIYSFFYINVLGLVYDFMPRNKTIFLVTLFIMLVVWKSWEGINTVRTWTGAWIFMYGLLNFLKTNKKKYLLFILFTPLIHFAYLVFSLSFWIYYYVGKKPKLYFALFIFSLIFSLSNTSILRNIASNTKLFQEKMDVYAIEDENKLERVTNKKNQKEESSSFHKAYYADITENYTRLILFFIIFRFGYLIDKIKSDLLIGLISTALCLLSIINFVGGIIPPIHNRGMIILGLIVLSASIIIFSESKSIYYSNNLFSKLTLPIKTITIFVFALAFYHKVLAISAMTNVILLSSPLTYFVLEETISIREMIEYLY